MHLNDVKNENEDDDHQMKMNEKPTETIFKKCECGKKLIYVQNSKRKLKFFAEYWCDGCDKKFKPSDMLYHCKDYAKHQKDFCVKCTQHLQIKWEKTEMDELVTA